MSITNFTKGGTQAKAFEELLCSPSVAGGLQQESVSFAAVHFLLSISAFLGNFLILVALRKESSLHPPSKLLYCCLATTDLLVGLVCQPFRATFWMSIFHEHWNLCRYAFESSNTTAYVFCSASLMTITALSVDRLFALLLGLRYRQIVTLKRTSIIVAAIWIVSSVAALCYTLDFRILIWSATTIIPFCFVISVTSYIKIFQGLSHHQAQVQDHVQQQPSQPNALNMVRYKKAVYSAVWVQLALVVCYSPYFIVAAVITSTKTYSLNLVVIREVAVLLIYFNSTLNPSLYCWKISEVRQAVKQTIRQALCCPWS